MFHNFASLSDFVIARTLASAPLDAVAVMGVCLHEHCVVRAQVGDAPAAVIAHTAPLLAEQCAPVLPAPTPEPLAARTWLAVTAAFAENGEVAAPSVWWMTQTSLFSGDHRWQCWQPDRGG